MQEGRDRTDRYGRSATAAMAFAQVGAKMPDNLGARLGRVGAWGAPAGRCRPKTPGGLGRVA